MNTIQADVNGGAATFEIGVDGTALAPVDVRQATLVFEKNNQLAGPAGALPDPPGEGTSTVSVDKTRELAVIARGDDTTCTITVQNNTFSEQDMSVRGGAHPAATKRGRGSAGSPFGYVPLSAFGSTADIGASHEPANRCRTTSSPRSRPTSTRPMMVASGSTLTNRIASWSSSSGRACPIGVTVGHQP